LSNFIDEFQAEWVKTDAGLERYQNLLKMRNLEMTAATHLATKLRLTNQSRYMPRGAARAERNTLKGSRPWEA
jgi:hypothetical protein